MTTTVKNADNLVDHVQVQGRLVPVRKYWMADHWEFRFPYKDPATGIRRFICASSIERAKEAASKLQEPVLTPAQAQQVVIQATVK
jgi:hypothetical protein